MAEEAQQTAGAADSGKPNKVVLIATILNTVGMLVVIVLLFLSHQKEKSKVSVENIAVNEPGGHGEAGGHGDAGGHGGGHGDAGGHGGGHGAAAKAAPTQDAGVIIPLDVFNINLASVQGAQTRFLKMNMSMELDDDADQEDFKVKAPKIRDAIINILNSKKPSDVASTEGREALKNEVIKVSNSLLAKGKVKSIFFTNFVISN